MLKTLIFALFLVLPFLAGCQGFTQPTPAPTLTVVSLAGGVKVEPMGTPQAVRDRRSPGKPDPDADCSADGSAHRNSRVAPRIMALGVRPSLAFHALPQAGAAVVATLPARR